MILEEMQAAVDRLCAAMVAKGVNQPEATIDIRSNAAPNIYLWTDTGLIKSFRQATLPDLIAQAEAYIAALPDPEIAALRRFTEATAKALDIAREESLPDEISAPLKTAIGLANDLMALPKPQEVAQ